MTHQPFKDVPNHPLWDEIQANPMSPADYADMMRLTPEEKALLVEHGMAQIDPLDLIVINGQDIKEATYPETEFIVPTVLPEGLTLLAAAPKIGKSWFVLQVAAAVSTGQPIFGGIQLENPRRVLYMALEDSPRRIQKRLDVMGLEYGANVDFIFDLKDNNPADIINAWFQKHLEQKPLVIVDTYGRTLDGEKDATYSSDYAGMAHYKHIIPGGCSLLFVHHTKKADEGDFLQALSGTNGLAGAADTIIVLKRERLSKDATLSITSREMEESEHHLNFSTNAVWTIGDRPSTSGGTVNDRIIKALTSNPVDGLTMAQIVSQTELSENSIKAALNRLIASNTVLKGFSGRFTLRNEKEEIF